MSKKEIVVKFNTTKNQIIIYLYSLAIYINALCGNPISVMHMLIPLFVITGLVTALLVFGISYNIICAIVKKYKKS